MIISCYGCQVKSLMSTNTINPWCSFHECLIDCITIWSHRVLSIHTGILYLHVSEGCVIMVYSCVYWWYSALVVCNKTACTPGLIYSCGDNQIITCGCGYIDLWVYLCVPRDFPIGGVSPPETNSGKPPRVFWGLYMNRHIWASVVLLHIPIYIINSLFTRIN